MMAKPMLVTLPGLLLILDAWPYGRLRSPGRPLFGDQLLIRRCLEKLPFLLLALVCAGLTLAAQSTGGALRSIAAIGLADRIGNAIIAYGMYLASSVVPVSLSFLYRFAPPEPAAIALAAATLLTLSVAAVRAGGAVCAGWLWFLLTLLPVIGLVAIGDHGRADRYMYIPMIGLLLALTGVLAPLSRLRPAARNACIVAGLATLALFATLAHRYTAVWRDSETLFAHALRLDPQHYIAHTLLAIHHEHRGNPESAIHHADAALTLSPNSTAAANAAVSASNAAMMLGRTRLAEEYLAQAISADPRFALPHYNLGLIALGSGRADTSVTHFERALTLNPRYSEAANNLGVAQLQSGRLAEARTAFARAVALDPRNVQARRNLASFTGGG